MQERGQFQPPEFPHANIHYRITNPDGRPLLVHSLGFVNLRETLFGSTRSVSTTLPEVIRETNEQWFEHLNTINKQLITTDPTIIEAIKVCDEAVAAMKVSDQLSFAIPQQRLKQMQALIIQNILRQSLTHGLALSMKEVDQNNQLNATILTERDLPNITVTVDDDIIVLKRNGKKLLQNAAQTSTNDLDWNVVDYTNEYIIVNALDATAEVVMLNRILRQCIDIETNIHIIQTVRPDSFILASIREQLDDGDLDHDKLLAKFQGLDDHEPSQGKVVTKDEIAIYDILQFIANIDNLTVNSSDENLRISSVSPITGDLMGLEIDLNNVRADIFDVTGSSEAIQTIDTLIISDNFSGDWSSYQLHESTSPHEDIHVTSTADIDPIMATLTIDGISTPHQIVALAYPPSVTIHALRLTDASSGNELDYNVIQRDDGEYLAVLNTTHHGQVRSDMTVTKNKENQLQEVTLTNNQKIRLEQIISRLSAMGRPFTRLAVNIGEIVANSSNTTNITTLKLQRAIQEALEYSILARDGSAQSSTIGVMERTIAHAILGYDDQTGKLRAQCIQAAEVTAAILREIFDIDGEIIIRKLIRLKQGALATNNFHFDVKIHTQGQSAIVDATPEIDDALLLQELAFAQASHASSENQL